MTAEDKPDPQQPEQEIDPVLALFGLYSEIWDGIDPDEHVRRLRENWTDLPLAPAHELDDFQLSPVAQFRRGPSRLFHNLPVQFHGNTLRVQL